MLNHKDKFDNYSDDYDVLTLNLWVFGCYFYWPRDLIIRDGYETFYMYLCHVRVEKTTDY